MGDREPLLTAAGIVAIVSAVLVFLQTMGVPVSDEVQEAIIKLVAILAPIALGFIARQFVYAPATAARINDIAYAAGMDNVPKPTIPPPPAKQLDE